MMDTKEEAGSKSTSMGSIDEKYHYYHHGTFKAIFVVILSVLILGLTFAAGRVSNRNFALRGVRNANIEISRDEYGGMMGNGGNRMMNGYHGGSDAAVAQIRLVGQISSTNESSLTIKDTDGTDYTIKIADTTSIIINNKIDKASNLKTSAQVVIQGTSNSDGSISANMIRSAQ